MASSNPLPLILVVDDYEDAREMYAEYLQFSGLRAATARNGEEAISLARKLKPALILMDLSMPGMDGWEASRILKSDERTRHIPIIALTGHALSGNEDEARRSGCDGFIAKPCLPPDLVAKVKASLGTPARFPTMDARPGTIDSAQRTETEASQKRTVRTQPKRDPVSPKPAAPAKAKAKTRSKPKTKKVAKAKAPARRARR